MHDVASRAARRRVLQLAAASPLAMASASGLWATPLGELFAGRAQTSAGSQQIAHDEAAIIAKAEDALDFFDFGAVARPTLPPAHFGSGRRRQSRYHRSRRVAHHPHSTRQEAVVMSAGDGVDRTLPSARFTPNAAR